MERCGDDAGSKGSAAASPTPPNELRMMTVTTHSKAEAECIANELTGFGSAIKKGRRGWCVNVAADERLVPILTVLERCLDDNGITSVTVNVHDRTYIMEAASESLTAPTAQAT